MKPTTSPHTRLGCIPIGDCKWTNGFWADKLKTCEESMLPYMGELLCGDIGHALNNFKIAAGMKEGEHQGMFWHDGDFYKWLEAATYVYAQNGDEKILQRLDEHIAIIAKAQMEDGISKLKSNSAPKWIATKTASIMKCTIRGIC